MERLCCCVRLSSGGCKSCQLVMGQCGRLVHHGYHASMCFECLQAALFRHQASSKVTMYFPSQDADAVARALCDVKATFRADAAVSNDPGIFGVAWKVVLQIVCHELSRRAEQQPHMTDFPRFLLLCRTADGTWCLQPTSYYFHHFVFGTQRDAHDKTTPSNACDFIAFAKYFGIEYMGTWMNSTGTEGDSFQEVSSELPYFPSSLPPTHRKTYWRLRPSQDSVGSHTILISSLQELLLGLCDALGHRQNLATQSYIDLLDAMKRRVAGEIRSGQGHAGEDSIRRDLFADRVLKYFSELDPQIWAERVPGGARPVMLEDYNNLASLAGYRYLGGRNDDGTYDNVNVPATIFYSQVFWDTGHVVDGIVPAFDFKKGAFGSYFLMSFLALF